VSGHGFSVDARFALLLVDLGLSPGNVLRRAGLPGDLFSRVDAALSPEEYYRLWNAIEDEAGDPALPVRIVEALSAEVFDVAIFSALCSRDLNAAALRVQKFKPLIAPLRLGVTVTKQATTIRPDWSAAGQPPAGLELVELLFWVRLVRLGTRHHVVPASVVGPDSEASAACSEYLSISYSTGPDHVVRFSARDAEQPFLTANEAMLQQFEPELRSRLEDLRKSDGTTEKVRAALVELLPSGQTGIDAAAARLAVSTRTLQRQLHREGTSFQSVLASTRERLARHYLATEEIPVEQISYLLGYEEPTSFGRAFTGWTGMSPHRLRTGPS